jgi:hypothetical protein
MAERMHVHTASKPQAPIDSKTERNVSAAADQAMLDDRMRELDREWDAERVLYRDRGERAFRSRARTVGPPALVRVRGGRRGIPTPARRHGAPRWR